MKGIDVSHYQTVTNYATARNAIDFVFMKLTQASPDTAWPQHYIGFNGKLRGGYHFTNLGNIPAEVAMFKSQWQKQSWELDPMLDAEVTGINSAYIKAWIAEFRAQTGHQRIYVYSSKTLFEGACNPAGFADANTPLWAARYYSNNPSFSTLGWTHPDLQIYQYWNAGTVPGISGGVDMDVTNINLQTTTQNGGFLMSLTDQQQTDVYGQLLNAWQTWRYDQIAAGAVTGLTLVDMARSIDREVNSRLNYNDRAEAAKRPTDDTLFGHTVSTHAVTEQILTQVQAQSAQIAALSQAVATLAADPNLTVDQVTQIVNTAVAEHIQITGTINISPAASPSA